MENNSKSVKDEKPKITYSAERTNLQEFGYSKSGSVQGDPDVYASYLERILNGDLVDEQYKGLSETERKEKREKIKDLEKALDDTKKNNAKFEADIKVKEKQIEEHREELLHIRKKRAEDEEKLERESFSTLKFSIVLFVLVFLTAYLFFFYISAAYKALYVDFEGIASRLADGLSTGSIMPGPAELAEALRYNYLLFFVPFVFYAFGLAFHVLLDLKHKAKIVFVSLLITVTFIVDLLLALIIHNNTESAKELMGLATMKWSQNPTFYIILCLGFLAYILWSILLDFLIREWRKRQVTLNLKRIINHLRKDIKILTENIMPIELIINEINILRDEVDTYVQGNLKGFIDQFTTGWVSYLAPDNLKNVKTKCLNIRDGFIEKHKIQPGIVKVIKAKRK
ncbi:MAG: hypothetical protein JXB24_10370 [Bacteroidales bacterium]|nr:hypothetical protein [Bacteroidales bacterium]